MIEAQLAGGKPLAAILAVIFVAGKNVPPAEADRLPRQAVVFHEANHPWHLQLEVDRANPILLRLFVQGIQVAVTAVVGRFASITSSCSTYFSGELSAGVCQAPHTTAIRW